MFRKALCFPFSEFLISRSSGLKHWWLYCILIGSSYGQSIVLADRSTAIKSLTDLLRTPPASPSVSVTVHGTEQEENLIIEDISWDSLDGEPPTAFVIRPQQATAPLPAIVCLHGTGGFPTCLQCATKVILPPL